MKKVFSFVAVAAMTVALYSCGEATEEAVTEGEATVEETVETVEEEVVEEEVVEEEVVEADSTAEMTEEHPAEEM